MIKYIMDILICGRYYDGGDNFKILIDIFLYLNTKK